MSCNCNDIKTIPCDPCGDCPPENKYDYIPCPIHGQVTGCDGTPLSLNCILYTGPDLSCMNINSQTRFNDFLIALEAKVCTLIHCFPTHPPCINLEGAVTATLTHS